MKAIWNDKVLAESDNALFIEGNYYFPLESINRAYFVHSTTRTLKPALGTIGYYSIRTDDKVNPDAAWFYVEPKAEIAHLVRNRVAFGRSVQVVQ